MSFTVRELPKARLDKQSIFRWLHQRSPTGAATWLRAYDALVERLEQDAHSFAVAPENKDCDFHVQQALFKTRRGRVYRVLFFIQGEEVYILRVRGPGQAPVNPEEMT
jgi:plasmid stabilization system protein ParE